MTLSIDTDLPVGSLTSSAADFDFLIGKWTVRNRKLKSRLDDCTEWDEFDATLEAMPVLGDTGNMEQYRARPNGVPYYGMAVRLFEPATRLWRIYWANANQGTLDAPVVGSFEDKVGLFYADDTFQGRPILVLYKWDATNPEQPIWSQAFSTDHGQTWEWNWYMYLQRAAE
jgi:hypothetical protein